MTIDYSKELESAARSMILVHEPDTLIRMIVRMMIQKVKVVHAGILLHDEVRKTYVMRVSRGPTGIKIPSEFARMDYDNPLIQFFREKQYAEFFKEGYILYPDAERLLRKKIDSKKKETLHKIIYQMDILESVVCIPSYFRNNLLGILFLGKKKNRRKFKRKELDFFVALASDVAMAIRNAQLFKQFQDELDKRRQLFLNTTIVLVAAIEAKDNYTRGHTERVTNISVEIGRKLLEDAQMKLEPNFIEHLQIAALLHDIGKIGIPESILNKEGALNDEEWQRMQQHSTIGANILQPIQELNTAIEGIKHHHERYDGTGYPDGLDNGDIPIIAAIIAVADSFDAMSSQRPYRSAKSREEAIEEIKNGSGKQFHPQVVSAFLELCQQGKI